MLGPTNSFRLGKPIPLHIPLLQPETNRSASERALLALTVAKRAFTLERQSLALLATADQQIHTARTRTCTACLQSKALRDFLREPVEPFHFARECKACGLGQLALPKAAVRESDVVWKQRERVARLEAEFHATNGQARFENTMSRLDACARATHDPAAIEVAAKCRDPTFLEDRMAGVQAVLGLSRAEAITIIREQQDLVLLSPDLLAQRLLDLKLALPRADVSTLVRLGPWLLLMEDVGVQLQPVLRQLQIVMPAFDVEEKLHQGSGVWWSAADMLRSNGRTFRYTQ